MSTAEKETFTPTADDKAMANAIRALAMDAVKAANSGHSGMPLGMADAATVLFTRHIKLDPKHPSWPDRDRFVLSAGHGSMLLYALNYLMGYEDMPIEEIKNFRQLGSRTAGHPEYGHASGIETTTGPLGQGIATAVGMALAERILNGRFGDDLVDHHTYVIAGDGCLMEGVSHEAIDLAGHLKLSRLIVLFDDNGITIDGGTDLATSMDQKARFKAAGWDVFACDGHDMAAVDAALAAAKASPGPAMIACKTVIGYGAPKAAGTAKAHGAITADDEIAGIREAIGWPHPPFVIPEDLLGKWRAAGRRCADAHSDWTARLAASDQEALFETCHTETTVGDLDAALEDYKKKLVSDAPKVATRKASEMALEVINGLQPNMIGGSADLTGSNNTKTTAMRPVKAGDYAGSYIYYGVREHGMAAAMNGIALHGGLIPYGGTFLAFTDYARPALRLSALMGKRVIYVMTHDSIGLGEDGPTHQPVEHIASLRAMPNLNVFRPADAVETAECWQAALADTDRPSVLALSRQGLPTVRQEHSSENLSAKGAYILRNGHGTRDVTLIATGSEVAVALAAAESLAPDGVRAAVVSMPSWEKFAAQEQGYRDAVLGTAPCVAVEAGVGLGWGRWIGWQGTFIGMHGFGASAPEKDLYRHFGITAEAVAAAARKLVGRG